MKRYTQEKIEGMEKIFHAMYIFSKAGVAIFISDKIVFKTKVITRDKEGHYKILKGVVQQEYIIL